MTTDEHRAAVDLLRAEAEGRQTRPLTQEEGAFVHACIEDLGLQLAPARRSRLLRLADRVVPWHDSRQHTRQQRAALDALVRASDAGRLKPFEKGLVTKLWRSREGMSPKQEARLFEIADERTPGWRARLGELYCPPCGQGAA